MVTCVLNPRSQGGMKETAPESYPVTPSPPVTHIHTLLKMYLDGSEGSLFPGFYSQHSHDSSQPTVTPLPEPTTLFWPFTVTRHRCDT